MTTTETEQATGPVESAIYNLHGRLHIFTTGYLVPVHGAINDIRSSWTDQAELVATPGSEFWATKMIQFRNSLALDLRNAKADVQQQKTLYKNLGEAILAEADAREWCEEYDEFASQWGLPTRTREYEVTVRIRVLARSEEEAQDHVNIQVEDEHQGGEYPDFSVREYER